MTSAASHSTEPVASSGPALTGDEGWRAVRGDESIQFSPIEPPKQEPPDLDWLDDFFRWLGDLLQPVGKGLGMSWPVFKWVLIGLAAAGVLWLAWRLLEPLLQRSQSREDAAADWTPHHGQALALLEEADRLAADGRYDEATHLLLQRSVAQIAGARPDLVEPSSTARELAALPALPDSARTAFRVIAERVERSLFALRQLGREDWDAARAAYAEFALQRLPERSA